MGVTSAIVANRAANLGQKLYDRFNIHLTPVQMAIDGVRVDTVKFQSTIDIDDVVKSAKAHPHILGTSAAEFVPMLSQLQRSHSEIFVVVTAKRTIGTYDAALAAARTMQAMGAARGSSIHVIDSGSLDLGTGLVTLFVAGALKEGHHGRELVAAAEAVGRAGKFTFSPRSLDYIVRSGRASFLQAQAAELFNRRAMLGFVNGEAQKLGTISKSGDVVAAITDDLIKHVGRGKAVWCGVMHAAAESEAARLEASLRSAFDVRLSLTREVSAGVYMSVGAGAVGAFVTPCDSMAWPVSPDVT